jgi:hypothetical protein
MDPSLKPLLFDQPDAWFSTFNETGRGLSQAEISAGLFMTFGPTDAATHDLMHVTKVHWRTVDPSGLGEGKMTLDEFLKRDGLKDSWMNHLDMKANTAHSFQSMACNVKAKPLQGRRKALLVGINYVGMQAELSGCVGDVENMTRLLTETCGWERSCIKTLVDDQATYDNILHEMKRLVAGARPGDSFFFQFSGHGVQEPDPHGYEEDGMNETIVPIDFQTHMPSFLTDDTILETLVVPLPENCRLTAVMDCCHSGTGMDLPFVLCGDKWTPDVNPYFTSGDVVLFSGCQDDQESADFKSMKVKGRVRHAGGAMTTALTETLREFAGKTLSYSQLMQETKREMKLQKFTQKPNLTASQAFDVNRKFCLHDAVPNTNKVLGRQVTTRFKPRPNMEHDENDPMIQMLGPYMAWGVRGPMRIAEKMGGEKARKKAEAGIHMLAAALGMSND